jgi:hypothetical protein
LKIGFSESLKEHSTRPLTLKVKLDCSFPDCLLTSSSSAKHLD